MSAMERYVASVQEMNRDLGVSADWCPCKAGDHLGCYWYYDGCCCRRESTGNLPNRSTES